MENKCAVIKDLMPLYVDQVLSDESIELVESHISGCDECSAVLCALSQDVPQELTEGTDITTKQAMQTLGKSIKRSVEWRVLLAAVLTALLASGAVFGYQRMFVVSNTPIPVADMEYRFSEMTDGGLVFEYKIVNGRNWRNRVNWMPLSFIGGEYDGKSALLIEVNKPMFDLNPNAPSDSSYALKGEMEPFDLWYRITDGYIVDEDYPSEEIQDYDKLDMVVIGGRNERAVIWRKGDIIPPTDPAVERELVQRQNEIIKGG